MFFAGLGYWSEQAFEAVHANFKIDWDTVKVDIGHKDFMTKLTETVTIVILYIIVFVF